MFLYPHFLRSYHDWGNTRSWPERYQSILNIGKWCPNMELLLKVLNLDCLKCICTQHLFSYVYPCEARVPAATPPPQRVLILLFRHTKFSKRNRIGSRCLRRPLREILDPPLYSGLKGYNWWQYGVNAFCMKDATTDGASETMQISYLLHKEPDWKDNCSFTTQTFPLLFGQLIMQI